MFSNVATVRDFLQLPEGPPYYELVNGELVEKPCPDMLHQIICANVVRSFFTFLNGQRIGEVFFGLCGVYLTKTDAYQPDVFYIANERLSIIEKHGVQGAPDLVIEVLSPSTERHDKGPKKKIYAATGVEELWLVDPRAREVAVFDLQQSVESPRVTVRANGKFESPLFPGLTLHGVEIFRDPRRKFLPKRPRRS